MAHPPPGNPNSNGYPAQAPYGAPPAGHNSYPQGGYGHPPPQAGSPHGSHGSPPAYGAPPPGAPPPMGYPAPPPGAAPAGPPGGLPPGAPAAPTQLPIANSPVRQLNPNEMKTTVELNFCAENLIDMDTLSKSDPFAVVYESFDAGQGRGKALREVGRTETIQDNLNPQWAKAIEVDYHFEETQEIVVRLYDEDDPKAPLSKQDFLGEAHFCLADAVCARQTRLELKMPSKPGKKCGFLTVTTEEQSGSMDEVVMTVSFRKLDKKHFGPWGKSNPFLEISKSTVAEGGSAAIGVGASSASARAATPKNSVVTRTDPVKNTLTGTWKPITIRYQRLCGCDGHRPLKITVNSHEASGSHKLIGSMDTSFAELQEKQGNGSEAELALVNEAKKKRVGSSYQNSGILRFVSVKLVKRHSFLDYIRGGFQISMVCAIDFTASNGDPSAHTSLHFRNPSQPNDYIRAIMSVCDIVSHYDRTQQYAVYGFGAKVPPSYTVDHCFPCNFRHEDPTVRGVQGILDAYAGAINQVQLYGPTLFAPIIRKAAELAKTRVNTYHILLIMTDGAICDMQPTIDAIVEASKLPLSIIIVGIGQEDFSKMDILDADEVPLKSSKGVMMSRDIVQFVPFRDFKNAPFSKLAQETLKEVPDQFLSWARASNVAPADCKL